MGLARARLSGVQYGRFHSPVAIFTPFQLAGGGGGGVNLQPCRREGEGDVYRREGEGDVGEGDVGGRERGMYIGGRERGM